MLLQKFIEETSHLGIPAYIDSSEAGHGLYLKYGFRDLEEMLTDFGKWGKKEPHRVWAMIKEL